MLHREGEKGERREERGKETGEGPFRVGLPHNSPRPEQI
jgi:hypothetical protein